MNATLRDTVRSRAGGRCEYCRIPERLSEFSHQIDHIVAEQHLGPTSLENLALCCIHCNLHKGPNLTGWDTETQSIVPLFHPRADHWHEHFRYQGALLVRLSLKGRITIQTLKINAEKHVKIREHLLKYDPHLLDATS